MELLLTEEDLAADTVPYKSENSASARPLLTRIKKRAAPKETAVAPQQKTKSVSFADINMDKWLLSALAELSILAPTDVQRECIPKILQGRDVIASAKTGQGKTLAFALPMLQKLAKDPFGIFGLVLTPTRELAFQIAEQFRVIGTGINLKFSILVGGLDMMAQAIELARRPHIIVCTPGRLRDHIASSDVDLSRLKFLTYLFVPSLVKDAYVNFILSSTYGMNPGAAKAEKSESGKPASKKRRKADSQAAITQSLEGKEDYTSVIIFTGRWKTCERLYLTLRELGIRCTAIHSRLSQNERLASIAKFKSGLVRILVTTDVGSRGLDIPQVKVVLNYDLPADATDYIHRIGRTARAGRGGISISIVGESDVDVLKNIEDKIGKKLEPFEEAPEKDVLELLDDTSIARRTANMSLAGNSQSSKYARRLRELK
ncbi:MAG: hypothetical protein SGCHY_001073 [Lobulomycetales sp.]